MRSREKTTNLVSQREWVGRGVDEVSSSSGPYLRQDESLSPQGGCTWQQWRLCHQHRSPSRSWRSWWPQCPPQSQQSRRWFLPHVSNYDIRLRLHELQYICKQSSSRRGDNRMRIERDMNKQGVRRAGWLPCWDCSPARIWRTPSIISAGESNEMRRRNQLAVDSFSSRP